MTVASQQDIANRILDRLFLIDPHVIVAGGAPRDWHLGQEASDIDVYLYPRPDITPGVFQEMLAQAVGFKVAQLGPEDDTFGYTKNPALRSVYDGVFEDEKIQFIRMKESTFESVVPHFPLSICKAWFKDGKIKYYPIFKQSIDKKLLIKTSEGYGDSDKYIQKIRDKFPYFRYIGSATDVLQIL